MEYRCISADSHIDLCWMPHDLFVSNASRALKDRMPYVAQGPDGPKWVTKSGVDLGFANGKGGTGAVNNRGRKYVPGEVDRLDRIAKTGLYSDGCQDIFRPTTPELRLKDQDRDGIQAEVIYGLLGTGAKLTDREASLEFYRIYNEWLASFCSNHRKRFVGLASIPNRHSVDDAVAETRRAARLGLGGLDVSTTWDMIPLWNPYWDPFWKTAAEVNLPVHFHTVGTPPVVALPEDSPQLFKLASLATREVCNQLSLTANILSAVIHGGALDRFPSLRIVLGESGIGWIPYALDRMDHEYVNRYSGLGLKLKPSDYWHRQCRATFQDDRIGAMLLNVLGVENVMWASDYPHPDCVFPDSQEYIQRQFGHLSEVTQRKITCENAGKFYGLM